MPLSLHLVRALRVDADNISLAVGVDQLLGADAPYWLYRHKHWFGVLFGPDLN